MYNNPYFNPTQGFRYQQPIETLSQSLQTQTYIPPTNNQAMLLGELVDNIEAVKVMRVSMDGNTSYYPLMDGTAIVTKKLQADGTSKTVIYKPVEEEKTETPKYVTLEELEKKFNDIEIDDILEDLKTIKKDIKELKSKKKED